MNVELSRLDSRVVSLEARLSVATAVRSSQEWLTEQLHTLATGQAELYRRLDWLRARLDDQDGEDWKR
jgi:hypothetical protein